MIALVSHRASWVDRMRAAFTHLRTTDSVVYASPDAFLEANPPAAAVLLDAMTVVQYPELVSDCTVWRRLHPHATLVGVFNNEGGGPELRAMMDLHAQLDAEAINIAELTDPTFAREFLRGLLRGEARLQAVMRERFAAAVARTGRPLSCERPILMFLDLAPTNPGIKAVAREYAASRAKLTRDLRNANTLLASDLLRVMKVLWWVLLRDEGWDPVAITSFLHVTPRQWRKQMREHFGFRAKLLQHLPAQLVFDWVAHLCVERFPEPPSPRDIVATLVWCAEAVRERLNQSGARMLQELVVSTSGVRPHARNRKRCVK